MKIRRPSPAMAVAVVALVMSMTGGAIAAVNFARNAGKVDGKSAVSADASNRRAAGKLVAMDADGRLPFRFLAGTLRSESGDRLVAAPDNGISRPEVVLDLGVGTLLLACIDRQDAVGIENPRIRIGVTNYSGAPLHIARRAGNSEGAVKTLAPGTSDVFEENRREVFDIQLQNAEETIFVHGGVRQGGQRTANGACGAFATALFAKTAG